MSDYLISIQDAIDALKICDNNEDGINCHKCPLRDERWNGAWEDNETNCYTKLMRDSAKLLELSSADPGRNKGHWINEGRFANYHGGNVYRCSRCGNRIVENEPDDFCKYCGSYNRDGIVM